MKEVSQTVFETEWFNVERVTYPQMQEAQSEPYYRINSPDGVIVLAITDQNQIILVRQFRPALSKYTLEFPAGGIDPGETPAEAAARELPEETGYKCQTLEPLGMGHIMLNRHRSLLHAFFARATRPWAGVSEPKGTKVQLMTLGRFKGMVLSGKFDQITALSLFTLAQWKLNFPPWPAAAKH